LRHRLQQIHQGMAQQRHVSAGTVFLVAMAQCVIKFDAMHKVTYGGVFRWWLR
jgi:hypothetical protein